MKPTFTAAIIPALLALAASSAQAAPLQNGQFTQGVAGWQLAGDTTALSGSFLGASLGSASALVMGTASTAYDDDAPALAGTFNVSGLDPVETSSATGLETALGLAQGALGSNAYEGSGASQTFTVAAGDQLSFDYRLLTRDNGNAASEPDAAWLIWNEGGNALQIALSDSSLLAGGPAGWLDSGVQHYSFTSAYTGQATLGFAVVDVNSFGTTSLLAIQNIAMTPAVPEPQSLALALMGLLILVSTTVRPGDH
jgi:hypothetical protein